MNQTEPTSDLVIVLSIVVPIVGVVLVIVMVIVAVLCFIFFRRLRRTKKGVYESEESLHVRTYKHKHEVHG